MCGASLTCATRTEEVGVNITVLSDTSFCSYYWYIIEYSFSTIDQDNSGSSYCRCIIILATVLLLTDPKPVVINLNGTGALEYIVL